MRAHRRTRQKLPRGEVHGLSVCRSRARPPLSAGPPLIPSPRATSSSPRVSRGSWTKIPGSVCNGFSPSKQFRIAPAAASTDRPSHFDDEAYIAHSVPFLAAVARLEEYRGKGNSAAAGGVADGGLRASARGSRLRPGHSAKHPGAASARVTGRRGPALPTRLAAGLTPSVGGHLEPPIAARERGPQHPRSAASPATVRMVRMRTRASALPGPGAPAPTPRDRRPARTGAACAPDR